MQRTLYPSIVVVLPEQVEAQIHTTPEGRALVSNQVIATLPYPVRFPSALAERLRAQGLLMANSVLIQSPYDSKTYARAGEAQEQFALEKHLLFATFCGLLGAQSVQAELLYVHTATRNDTLALVSEAGGPLRGVAQAASRLLTNDEQAAEHALVGRVGGQHERETNLRTELSHQDRFRQGPVRLHQAEQLLTDRQLRGDQHMVQLLDLVRRGVTLAERRYVVSLSAELKGRLQIPAALKLPRVVDLDLQGQLAHQQIREYKVSYTIVF